MATNRLLAAVELSVYPYRVPAASESEEPIYDVVENPTRTPGALCLAVSNMIAMDFQFDVQVKGTSWTDVLTNIATLKTAVEAAEEFTKYGTGTQVVFKERYGNQSSYTQYNVVRGEIKELRSRRIVERLVTYMHVKLHCEPEPV